MFIRPTVSFYLLQGFTYCKKLLQRFWHFQEPPCGDVALTAVELKALTHFKNTVRRQPDRIYMVSLPKRSPIPELG